MTDRANEWAAAPAEVIGGADPTPLLNTIDEWCGPLEGTILLDYGAGTGRVAIPLAEAGADIIAADPNPEYLKALEDHPRISTFLLGGELTEELPEVNHAYATNVFIHFPHDYAARALHHLASAVDTGGLVLVQMPIYAEARAGRDWRDVTTWTEAMVEEAADNAGLDIVSLHDNPGRFEYGKVGPRHGFFQVMTRR